jgi:uncharacterized membrane protein YuzA (DUF378 family)
MNKKGINLPVKVFLGFVLLLTFLAGVNNVFIGLTRIDLIGRIMMPQGGLITYVIMGLSVLITAAVLSFKIFKKK